MPNFKDYILPKAIYEVFKHELEYANLRRAKSFLLAGKGNIITDFFKVKSSGGCGMMGSIPPNQFTLALNQFAKNDCNFIGVCRIGEFEEKEQSDIGYGIKHFGLNTNSILISVGLTGISLHKIATVPDKDSWSGTKNAFLPLKLKIK